MVTPGVVAGFVVTKVYEPTLKVDKDVQLHELNSCVTLKTVLLYAD